MASTSSSRQSLIDVIVVDTSHSLTQNAKLKANADSSKAVLFNLFVIAVPLMYFR